MSLCLHQDYVIPMHFFHVNCKTVISDLATVQITSTFHHKPWLNQECENQGWKRGCVGGAGGSSRGGSKFTKTKLYHRNLCPPDPTNTVPILSNDKHFIYIPLKIAAAISDSVYFL